MAALSLPDAKAYLDIDVATYDDEITAIIAAAEAMIAARVGPLEPTAVTRRLPGGRGELVLPVTPVVELTSVTPYNGTALTLTALHLDLVTGEVTQDNMTGFPATYYDVVYTAGRAACPSDLLYAVKEQVRYQWQPKRGPKARPTSEQDSAPGQTRGLAPRVREMIAPHVQIPAG